jgi:hypothetical protein
MNCFYYFWILITRGMHKSKKCKHEQNVFELFCLNESSFNIN